MHFSTNQNALLGVQQTNLTPNLSTTAISSKSNNPIHRMTSNCTYGVLQQLG
ncbi:unnamed protein product, partial [marine sediment metagenome]